MSYPTGTSLGLETMKVDIDDTSYLSTYFNITEFNSNLGAGKNLLIVNTSPLLSKNPDIKIEARDSKYNYLYIELASIKDEVSYKQKYYYSLHVYESLSSGDGKITIIGKTVDNKTVRWTQNIVISAESENTSKIVLYNKPKLKVFPLITYGLADTITINKKIISGSFYSLPKNPPKDFDLNNNYNKFKLDYRIISNNNNFVSDIEGFPITLNVNQIKAFGTNQAKPVMDSDDIIINRVLSKNHLLLSDPYASNNKVSEIVDGTYTCSFNSVEYNSASFFTQSYVTESINFSGGYRTKKFSYGLISYSGLDTFSGNIKRHKVYKKNLTSAGDYELVLDEIFSDYELLKDVTTPNKSFERIGYFYTQFHINNFWFTSSNGFNLYYDNSVFINSMKISGSYVSSGYTMVKPNSSYTERNANYIPYVTDTPMNFASKEFDSNFLHFYANSKYTLSLNAIIQNKIDYTKDATIEFYIKSSTPTIQNEIGYDLDRGIKIGQLTFSKNSTVTSMIFDTIQNFDFSFLNETYGTLVIYGNNFNSAILSDLSIIPTKVFGFTQDVYSTKIQLTVTKPNDIFEIKSELYDKDANLAYTDLSTVQYFDPNGDTTTPILTTMGVPVIAGELTSSAINVTSDATIAQSLYITDPSGGIYSQNAYINNIYGFTLNPTSPPSTCYLHGTSSLSDNSLKTNQFGNVTDQNVFFNYGSQLNISGDTTILSTPIGLYNSAFFDYSIKQVNSLAFKAGTIIATFSNAVVSYTDVTSSTAGFSGVTMTVDTDGTNINLKSIISNDSWDIKAFGRFL